jgi:hypothetical protein
MKNIQQIIKNTLYIMGVTPCDYENLENFSRLMGFENTKTLIVEDYENIISAHIFDFSVAEICVFEYLKKLKNLEVDDCSTGKSRKMYKYFAYSFDNDKLILALTDKKI